MHSAWGIFRIPPQIYFRNERGGDVLHLNRIGNGKQRDVFEVQGMPEWIAKLEVLSLIHISEPTRLDVI
eukprot:4061644-Prorocentrum_lima.AAC.1